MTLLDFKPGTRVRALFSLHRTFYGKDVPQGTLGTVRMIARGEIFVFFDRIGVVSCAPSVIVPA